MGRTPCCDKDGVKKGAWSSEEDLILIDYIKKHGQGSWRTLPRSAGLLRCGKSCRLRWINYLRPDIKRGPFSPEEEATIIRLQGMLGNKWAAIANRLPGRTDNEVKNFWNTHLKKRLFPTAIQSLQVGKPSGSSAEPVIKCEESPLTRHMVQWEKARVEAEARLSMQSSLLHSSPTKSLKYDHFLWLWNSNVGESFRTVKGMKEHACGSAISPATSLIKRESSSAVDSVQATQGKTSTSTDSSHGQEGGCKPFLSVMPGLGSISSNEFSDCSDTALKLLLLDFPCGNYMEFMQGHGESVSNFLDLSCDSNVSFSGTSGASTFQQ